MGPKKDKKTPLKAEIVGNELQRNVSTRRGSGADQFSDNFKGDMEKDKNNMAKSKPTVVKASKIGDIDITVSKNKVSKQSKLPATESSSSVKGAREKGKAKRTEIRDAAKAIKQAPRLKKKAEKKAAKIQKVEKRQDAKTKRVAERNDVAGKLRKKTEAKEKRVDQRADNKLKRQETSAANTAKRKANKTKRQENRQDNKLNRQTKKIAKAQGKIDKINSPGAAANKAKGIEKGVKNTGGSGSGGRGGSFMKMKSPLQENADLKYMPIVDREKDAMNKKDSAIKMAVASPMKKDLIGNQVNLPDGLKSAIAAAPVKYVQNASGVAPSQTNPFGEINQMNTNFNPQAQQRAQQMQMATNKNLNPAASPMMLNYKKKK